MQVIAYLVVALAGYLLGSIPTGYLVARAKGIDIRTVGSGNIGATNAFRVLGNAAGTAVLLADGLKGYAACAWLCDALLRLFHVPATDAETYRIVAGIAAVLGHCYTCWLWFKGGKGIATTAGVYLALAPLAVSIAMAAWILFIPHDPVRFDCVSCCGCRPAHRGLVHNEGKRFSRCRYHGARFAGDP